MADLEPTQDFPFQNLLDSQYKQNPYQIRLTTLARCHITGARGMFITIPPNIIHALKLEKRILVEVTLRNTGLVGHPDTRQNFGNTPSMRKKKEEVNEYTAPQPY